jgi:hypothetical protein
MKKKWESYELWKYEGSKQKKEKNVFCKYESFFSSTLIGFSYFPFQNKHLGNES